MEFELKDVYFRRFLMPIVITFLILCGIVVIVSNVPGTPVSWNEPLNQVAGALKKLTSK